MRNRRLFSLLLAVAVSAAPAAAQTGAREPVSPIAKSQLQARNILDAAITAHGGLDAIGKIKTIEYHLKGQNFGRFQTTTASAPFEGNDFEETTYYDLGANKISFEISGKGGGFSFRNRTIVANNEGKTLNYTGKTFAPLPPNPNQAPVVVQYQRRLPFLILQQAQNRILTARYLGTEMFEGRKHDIVTFVMPDTQQTALFIDAQTHLLSKYENAFTDTTNDTDVLEYIYGGYKDVAGVKVPSQITIKQAGEVSSKWNIDVKINPTIDEATFVAKTDGLQEIPAQAAPFTPKTVKLADNVALIQGFGNGAYNVMAVNFKDHIFVFEAPLNSGVADQAIRMIKEAFPNKPIKYVAVTHFHNDHTGGLRSFIAEGAKIVTTEANKKVFDAFAAAPLKDTLARNPRKPEYEFVKGKRVFTDGETSIELYDIGPNPHVKEILVGYLPKERILFEGDMFSPPIDERFPVGPAPEAVSAFFDKLKTMNLAVDKLVGVHGRVSTVDDLAKSVAEAGANDVKNAGQ